MSSARFILGFIGGEAKRPSHPPVAGAPPEGEPDIRPRTVGEVARAGFPETSLPSFGVLAAGFPETSLPSFGGSRGGVPRNELVEFWGFSRCVAERALHLPDKPQLIPQTYLAASVMICSWLVSAAFTSPARRPSERTRIRSQTPSSSGISEETIIIPFPCSASSIIRR